MKTSKRILSSILALVMLFSVCSTGFSVSAVQPNGVVLDKVVLEPIARPDVDFFCTTVTRVAKSADSVEPGNQIVKATPSGIPELSGAYAQQAYAGETPEATKVYFLTNTAGITPENISIKCDNETVTFSEMKVDTATGAYCCEITSGTAEVGSKITFTADYTWIDGNSYQEKCVTYVENISTGGSYAYLEVVYKPYMGMSSWYIGSASASTRLLGKGVYYEQPAEFTASTEDPYSSYGSYNVATGTYIDNVAGGYNTHLYTDDKNHQETMAPRVEVAYENFIEGTPVAHVYIDSASTKTLADINLRLDGNVANLADRNNDNRYTALDSVWVMSGAHTSSPGTLTNDATAQSILGYNVPAKSDKGILEKLSDGNGDQARHTVTGAVSQFGKLFTYGLTGSVSNIADGSSYTIINKYYSYFRPQNAYVTASPTVPTAMVFHVVDKGALAELLDYVMNSEPEGPTTRGKTKGANPQGWFYKSGFTQFQNAYTAALGVYNNPKATQSEIDAAAKSLQTMYNGLQLKNADYTQVDALLTEANTIIANKDLYNPDDIALVEEAKGMYVKNYNILYQGAVDTMAKNLKTAIDNASIRGAVYTEVNALVKEYEALRATDYSTDSWQKLEDAVNAVDYKKSALEQEEVDAMAKAIRDAIDNLVLVTADFRELKAKVAEAKEIDLSIYSNPEVLDAPLNGAETAIASHDLTAWNESRQPEVDALTTALDNAIKSLQMKPADKSALREAIYAEIPGKLEYYDQDVLAEYEALVVEGIEMFNDPSLTIKDQTTVNVKTTEITTKYAELMSTYDESCRHTPGEAVRENEKAATCVRSGYYDSVTYCTKCGEEISRTMVSDPAKGHTESAPVKEREIAPSCEVDGRYDTVVYCSVCNTVMSRVTTTVPATGHTEGEAFKTNEIAPTCTANGSYDLVSECTVCGEEASHETIVVPATGHTNGEAVVENKKDADCENKGGYDTVVYCTVCATEVSRKTTVIDALGHTEGEAVIENKKDADCVNKGGYDTVVCCTVCGEELSRVATDVEALGHTEAEAVEENRVEATCTTAGSYDMVVYCTVCDDEVSRKPFTIDALGHTEAEAIEEDRVEATCTTAGSYNMVVYCTVCNEKVSSQPYTSDALGHTEGEVVEENRVEATYEAAGSYDSVVYCTVCNEELSRETVEIPMLDGYFREATDSTTVINKELGYIYGLDIGLSDLEGYVEYSKSVSYETPDGIGTGMVLTTYRSGEEWETYTIIIFGDLNGDGVIDIYDASILAAIVNGDMELEEDSPILFAADLNGDTAVDIYDLAILNAVVNGETEIGQVPLV